VNTFIPTNQGAFINPDSIAHAEPRTRRVGKAASRFYLVTMKDSSTHEVDELYWNHHQDLSKATLIPAAPGWVVCPLDFEDSAGEQFAYLDPSCGDPVIAWRAPDMKPVTTDGVGALDEADYALVAPNGKVYTTDHGTWDSWGEFSKYNPVRPPKGAIR
jgi:hypothetical protein